MLPKLRNNVEFSEPEIYCEDSIDEGFFVRKSLLTMFKKLSLKAPFDSESSGKPVAKLSVQLDSTHKNHFYIDFKAKKSRTRPILKSFLSSSDHGPSSGSDSLKTISEV